MTNCQHSRLKFASTTYCQSLCHNPFSGPEPAHKRTQGGKKPENMVSTILNIKKINLLLHGFIEISLQTKKLILL